MPYCPDCGASIPEGTKFCQSCGAAVSAPAQTGAYKEVTAYSQPQRPTPVETGGLMAWSIITLLLCTIPGIVALVKTCNINKALTYEEQQKTLSSAKTWATVGTILGVLSVIGTLAGNMM